MSEGTAKSVFLLWHVRPMDVEGAQTDEKLIGAYETEAHAKAAACRLADRPGFRDFPEGFEVHEFVLNRDGWPEGFVDL